MTNHGYTGTQSPGPNAEAIVDAHLGTLNPERCIIVQGCCIGMDEIVGKRAHAQGFHVVGIVPANRSKVAPDYLDWCDTVIYMPEGTSYMDRNDEIVKWSYELTAFPNTDQEELRSGTWATVRRGWKKRIRVEIIPVGGV